MPKVVFSYGPLNRIINVRWGGPVYVILISEGTYATANSAKGVKVIERKTDPEIGGGTGAPVTATLLESSSNAGANFAAMNATAGGPDALERVEGIVVPKTTAAKNNWFSMYVVPISGERTLPTAPFLWVLNTMLVSEPRAISFKIRYAPHLVGPPPQGKAPMVQMYPNTTPVPPADLPGRSLAGWSVWAYRTDKKGTATKFGDPPEWTTDTITDLGGLGLLFGKDPPLIAADIPL